MSAELGCGIVMMVRSVDCAASKLAGATRVRSIASAQS